MLSQHSATLLILALALPVWGQGTSITAIDKFGGINDTDAAVVIPNYQAQDLLNVESNQIGTSIKKREGYALEAALNIGTASVDGSAFFYNSGGDQIRVVCYEGSCAKSTNNAAFSVFLTSATIAPQRWSFVTVDGAIYGANDKRDKVFKYDGTTLSDPAGIPRGSLLELTEDRLVAADTSANPSRVNYSKSGDYTTFTTGVNAVDPWTDDIGSPGDRVTGLKYYRGLLYIFKSLSITVCQVGDQYTTRCEAITDNLGTTNPTSLTPTPEGLMFKGSDGHYWRIEGRNYEKLSRDISVLVSSQTSGSTRSNTQTTQADWEAGTNTEAGSWNTTTRSGSIFPSSITFTDTSNADFSAGTPTNVSTIPTSGALTEIQGSSAAFINAGAESNSNSINWTMGGSYSWVATPDTPIYGAYRWGPGVGSNQPNGCFQVRDTDGNVLKQSQVTVTADQAAATEVIDTSTLTVSKIDIRVFNATCATLPGNALSLATSKQFIRGKEIVFGYADIPNPSFVSLVWDIPETNILTTGNLVSKTFDTAFTTPTWGPFSWTGSSTSAGRITFETQVATSSVGVWDSLVSVTPDARITSAQKRYIRYKASYAVDSATDTPANINDDTLKAVTTGQFTSQCIQPGSGISSFGIISCAEVIADGGSLTYYTRSASTCGGLTGAWSSQTNNAAVAASAAAAVQFRFDSVMASATSQAQIDACTIYWNEGTVAPPTWGLYHPTKNSVFWTVSRNNSATNNVFLKYDLNLHQWYVWDIAANAPLYVGNTLYLGTPSTGKIMKFGGVNNDDGAAINAYWKSKDFSGDDPFTERTAYRLSILAKNEQQGNATVTLGTGRNTTSAHTLSLSTTAGIPYIRDYYGLAFVSPHSFFNVKVGNNAVNQPFEILGLRLDFSEKAWLPLTP